MIIAKCAGLLLCGAGIGAIVTWLLMRNRRAITEVEARQRAEALYNRLMGVRDE